MVKEFGHLCYGHCQDIQPTPLKVQLWVQMITMVKKLGQVALAVISKSYHLQADSSSMNFTLFKRPHKPSVMERIQKS